MFTKRNLTYIVVLIFIIIIAYLLFNPGPNSGLTRLLNIKESIAGNANLMTTITFVESIESLRGRYELRSDTTIEGFEECNKSINQLLSEKTDINELKVYLRLYGKAMYFSSDGVGIYQVVFLSIARKFANDAQNNATLMQELMDISKELELRGMDKAEFEATLKGQPFP